MCEVILNEKEIFMFKVMIRIIRRLNEATPKNALQNNCKTTVSSKRLSREKNKNCVRDSDPFSSNTGNSQLAKDLQPGQNI